MGALMEGLGLFTGALIATFVVSRIVLRLLPRRDGRAIAAFVLSLSLCWVIVAFGRANGGPLVWEAGWTYVIPQAVWLCVDLFRLHSRQQTRLRRPLKKRHSLAANRAPAN
jgi:hypothetical protein